MMLSSIPPPLCQGVATNYRQRVVVFPFPRRPGLDLDLINHCQLTLFVCEVEQSRMYPILCVPLYFEAEVGFAFLDRPRSINKN
jgi:hypothetical protein